MDREKADVRARYQGYYFNKVGVQTNMALSLIIEKISYG